MRVLFLGDSPTVSTGFARCSIALCDELYSRGHEVSVIGINEFGGPHKFPYDIYPARNPFDRCLDGFGVAQLCVLIDRLRPDIAVILQDPWGIKPHFDELDRYFKEAPQLVPPIVGWLAVDSQNQLSKPLNRLAHVIAWTQFGANELIAGGYEGPISVIPLGVDHDQFKPGDKQAARRELKLKEDAFVVGVVGRNQPRKRIDIALEAFHRWISEYGVSNVELALHVAPTGDVGCNIRALVHYYKLHGKVILSEPHIGRGIDNLETFYQACDVHLNTSQGEGWALGVVESMACGVPCVVPSFAALGPDGWVDGAAVQVPCSHRQLTAPLNSLAYTIGAVPSAADVAEALNRLYSNRPSYEWYRRAGLERAAQFSWQSTGRQVADVLEKVVQERPIAVDATDSSLVLDSSPSELLASSESEFAAAV